jgi:nitrogen fixation protein FixH
MSGRKFTGWHMTGILVAFFGVVVSVNVFMAQAAISTFGGTVVDNSYVASQKFNGWLDKAEAQKALGWTVSARLNGSRHVS